MNENIITYLQNIEATLATIETKGESSFKIVDCRRALMNIVDELSHVITPQEKHEESKDTEEEE